MRTDLHQHVWTPQLVEQLARRRRLPLVDLESGLPVLHSDGERPYVIDPHSSRREALVALAGRDPVDQIVVAMSSPIGIETLPRAEAVELIEAHLAGVQALGKGFLAWGPVALDESDPADVDLLLAGGCVGISLPAPALVGADRLEEAGPLLERVARAGVPLFVHPGRPVNPRPREAPLDEPLWWQAMTDYVSQMQAAWLTFATDGRRLHRDLVVVFAMLAGCGPLQSERFEQRSGATIDLSDPLTFYDVSGYGPRASETMATLVGPSQLMYGSDRPVVEPALTGREAVLQAQASELLSRTERVMAA